MKLDGDGERIAYGIILIKGVKDPSVSLWDGMSPDPRQRKQRRGHPMLI